MHAKTRGRHPSRARRPGGHRSPGVPGPARRRSALASVLALGLVAAACSAGSEAGTDDASPTFSRADGASLMFEERVAKVSDLLAPATEDDPWTVVGSVFDPQSRVSVAAVWTSDDARGWDTTMVEPASLGTGESMAAVVPTDDGLLAVGQVGDGQQADAALWRQDGDGDWQQTRPDVMGGDHEQWAFDAAVGEAGIVVAGGENAWGEVRPRLWFSADGESWATVDGGPGGPLDGTGEESVHDIAAVETGFVAVGSRTLDSDQDGIVWHSPDGENWQQVDAPTLGGPGRQDLMTVGTVEGVVVAGGYSAHGSDRQGKPFVWRSADGLSWNEASDQLPTSDRRNAASDLSVRSLSVTAEGLIAAGGNDWRPHVWRSTDTGVSWEALPDPVRGDMFQGGVDIRDAVSAGGITVALGSEPTVLRLAGARWEDATDEAFPKGGDQPFGTSVAAGPEGAIAAGGRYTAGSGDTWETYTGQVWREADGQWDPVETEQLSAGHIMDATSFAGGYAAVGFEDAGLASGRTVAGDTDPDGLVWVSIDGNDWARIGVENARINEENLEYLENPSPEQAGVIVQLELEAPPQTAAPAGGPGTRSLSAVAPLADGFIAVGTVYQSRDADPIVIVSADGLGFVGEEPIVGGPGIQRYNDVCVAPDGTALAVGVSGVTGTHDVIVSLRQADGTWVAPTDTPMFTGAGSQQAHACAASDEGFVIVGSDDSSGNSDARVWTSEDGLTWTMAESGVLGGPGDQRAGAVAAVPDGGWLVAGTDNAAGDSDIALWRVASDGDISQRDQGEPSLSGPGDQTVNGLAIDEDGRVTLVGNDYGRVGLWESDSVDR